MIVVNSKTLRIKVAVPLLSHMYLNPFEYQLDDTYTIYLLKEDELGVSYGYNHCKIYGMVCDKCNCRICFTDHLRSDNGLILKVACDCERGEIILEKI